MKYLYLIRHAKSSWDNPYLRDFERPLNKRGLRDAPKMGGILASRKIIPDLIISSPANRAITTAKYIAEAVNYPHQDIVEDQNVYHAGSNELMKIISQTGSKINILFLFGHNPGFTYLANQLSDGYIDNLPTCGIYGIQFDFDTWSEVIDVKGKMTLLEYPKLYK